MGRKLRYIPDGGALVEVTCRTLQGRPLLRPSPELNDITAGILGRAQRLYPVDLVTFVQMSTHYHLLLGVDDAKRLARFVGYFNSNLAREVGRLTGWTGKIWERHLVPGRMGFPRTWHLVPLQLAPLWSPDVGDFAYISRGPSLLRVRPLQDHLERAREQALLNSMLSHLRRQRQSADWSVGRKPFYQQRRIESAVDSLLEIDSLLVEKLGHQAPILREVRQDLQRVITDLNHADDLTTEEPKVRSTLDKVRAEVRSVNVSGIAFGLVTIVSLLLTVPSINWYLFGSECPVVETQSKTARNGTEPAKTQVGCIEATPSPEEPSAQPRPEGRANTDHTGRVHPARGGRPVLSGSPRTSKPVLPPSLPKVAVPSEEPEPSSLGPSGPGSETVIPKKRLAPEVPVEGLGFPAPPRPPKEVLPVMSTRVSPECPKAQGELFRGLVDVNVLVAIDGHVKQTRTGEGIPAGSARAASRAARRSSFKTGTRGGVPAEMWVLVRYDFSSCSQ
jgi:hypothetical protein